MATDESVWYRLHRKLDEMLGPEEAALLMTGVPPFPWAEVATKRDLEMLHTRTRAEMRAVEGRLEGKIGSVEAKIGSSAWKIVLANTASTAALLAAFVAAIRL